MIPKRRRTMSKRTTRFIAKIPNNKEGNATLENLKKYLNKDSYKLLVRPSGKASEVAKITGKPSRTYWRDIPKEHASDWRIYLDIEPYYNASYEKSIKAYQKRIDEYRNALRQSSINNLAGVGNRVTHMLRTAKRHIDNNNYGYAKECIETILEEIKND
tara:strand:- start:830 stop:1306 length:477 start_codon:yes stop_codon:yes gene_type:complete